MSKSVKIDVAGMVLNIRSDAKKTYVRELAEFVTSQYETTRQSGNFQSTQAVALLTAMNVADELFSCRDELKSLKKQVREKTQTMLRYLDSEAKLADPEVSPDDQLSTNTSTSSL